jgi:2-polyprenyl-3-methyl-5-hydroxy-6-metoxy-1,4-benzoquinol methylase
VDALYLEELRQIYDTYDLFSLSGGSDQEVMSAQGMSTRSTTLVARLTEGGFVPAKGRLLDYGCGKGAFLAAFSQMVSDWELLGSDQSEANRLAIEQIPQATYEVGPISHLPGLFDVISLVHVLEHIVDPAATLTSLRDKLAPSGVLFIQVPNLLDNPFDLSIADHCSHYTSSSLSGLLERSGYEVIECRTDWVRKEVSAVARAASKPREDRAPMQVDATALVGWLAGVSTQLKALAASERPLGVLGTTNAALWADLETGQRVDFFLDDSPLRQGKDFYGRSVVSADDVPANACVYLPFVPAIAGSIAERLRLMGVDTRTPTR